MLAKLRERHEREDEGFTLIELMVVVLIIAILLAIAIPTFLGARERANDRAAQSNLRNAYTAAKSIYTDNETYTDATTTALEASEPTMTFVTGASQDSKEISVATAVDEIVVGAESKSGKCFWIREQVATVGGGATTGSGTGTFYAQSAGGAAGCSANTGLNIIGNSFGDAIGTA